LCGAVVQGKVIFMKKLYLYGSVGFGSVWFAFGKLIALFFINLMLKLAANI
jgi:hypothetical protein